MNHRKVILAAFFTLFISSNIFAQGGYKWGDNKPKAREKYILLKDEVNNKNFENALEPFRWLYEHIPDLHENLYILGIKAYSGLAKKKDVPAGKKQGYQDTVLTLYKQRADIYGNERDIYNRMAHKAWVYNYKDTSRYNEVYNIIDKSIKLNHNNIYHTYADAYIFLACWQNRHGKLSDKQVMNKYDTITNIIDYNIEQEGKYLDYWKKRRKEAQDNLSKCIEMDCDFAEKNLIPRYEKDTGNLELAKKIYNITKENDCFDDHPAFEKATHMVLKSDPGYQAYMDIAERYKKNDKTEKAIEYYKKAIENAGKPEDKAEAYINMAELKAQAGHKSNAKAYAKKALTNDPARNEIYTFLGNLYFNSYEYCNSKTEDPVKARAVFLAAYEMYKKAGDTQKMNQAKQQFPAMSQIFSQGYKVGEEINTGCWLNETVTIRKRPK